MNRYCYNADISMHEYKKKFNYNNIEVLELSIKYPKISLTNNPRAENLINNRIKTEIIDFVRYSKYLYNQAIEGYHESQANNYPFHGYSAYMEYTITYNENCFLSLYFDRYEFTGGAHGSTIRSSDTWTRQAEVIQQREDIYFDDYKELIISNFNENSFYLSPSGITIYYQQYDIAPYSTGIVEFTIPYDLINWHPNC